MPYQGSKLVRAVTLYLSKNDETMLRRLAEYRGFPDRGKTLRYCIMYTYVRNFNKAKIRNIFGDGDTLDVELKADVDAVKDEIDRINESR